MHVHSHADSHVENYMWVCVCWWVALLPPTHHTTYTHTTHNTTHTNTHTHAHTHTRTHTHEWFRDLATQPTVFKGNCLQTPTENLT